MLDAYATALYGSLHPETGHLVRSLVDFLPNRLRKYLCHSVVHSVSDLFAQFVWFRLDGLQVLDRVHPSSKT